MVSVAQNWLHSWTVDNEVWIYCSELVRASDSVMQPVLKYIHGKAVSCRFVKKVSDKGMMFGSAVLVKLRFHSEGATDKHEQQIDAALKGGFYAPLGEPGQTVKGVPVPVQTVPNRSGMGTAGGVVAARHCGP